MAELIFTIGLLIVSLFVLIKSADYLVDGASDFARFLHVSPLLVGLTIVAFGTSLPEFIVSLFSVLNGSADISLGNVIGSNIANIALVLGIAALFTPLVVKSKTLTYEFPFLIVSSFLLILLGNDIYIFGTNSFLLGRFDGAIFLLIFIIFIIYVYRSMLSEKKTVTKQFRKDFTHENPLWKNVLLMVGGIIGVVIGGKLFITEATVLASLAGLPKAFIGLTIAAIGTSLPELATSAVAAYKGKGDLAIGNIVGSNIFNILFVLGLTSMIKPIAINASVLSIDGMIMLFVTLLFLLFATTTKKLYRWEGGVLVVLYLSYLIWLIHGLF